MKAIWQGDMTKLEDIVKFQLILENTHTWAMRVLKPLLSSYIEQWRLVHCLDGMFAVSAAKLRRQQTMERCQSVIPMVQSFLDNQSSIELDDSKHSKLTPLLVGLLVREICTSERQKLVDEVDRIVTQNIGDLNMHSERITIGTQETRKSWTTSSDNGRIGSPSLDPTVENDDPNDSDYIESQATSNFQTGQTALGPSNAEKELRHSTRSNPRILALPRPPTTPPREPTSADDAPDTPSINRGSTPLSESTRLNSSDTSTPRSKALVLVGSSGSNFATPKPPQSLPRQETGSLTGQTPPKSVLFPVDASKWPPGRLFGQPQLTSEPPKIEWNSAYIPVQFNFQKSPPSTSVDQQSSAQPSPSSSRDSHTRGDESTAKMPFIDLTNDSQDS